MKTRPPLIADIILDTLLKSSKLLFVSISRSLLVASLLLGLTPSNSYSQIDKEYKKKQSEKALNDAWCIQSYRDSAIYSLGGIRGDKHKHMIHKWVIDKNGKIYSLLAFLDLPDHKCRWSDGFGYYGRERKSGVITYLIKFEGDNLVEYTKGPMYGLEKRVIGRRCAKGLDYNESEKKGKEVCN